MFCWRNKPVTVSLNEAEKNISYSTHVSRLEQKEVERLFARLFLSEDGKRALAYLQTITFQRAFGAETSDNHLRYVEGQRSMVANILRLIERGRQG